MPLHSCKVNSCALQPFFGPVENIIQMKAIVCNKYFFSEEQHTQVQMQNAFIKGPLIITSRKQGEGLTIFCHYVRRSVKQGFYSEEGEGRCQETFKLREVSKRTFHRQNVSLGNQGSGIESSTIQIPSCPNLLVDYDANPIPTIDFDLISIKIDRIR